MEIIALHNWIIPRFGRITNICVCVSVCVCNWIRFSAGGVCNSIFLCVPNFVKLEIKILNFFSFLIFLRNIQDFDFSPSTIEQPYRAFI